MEKMNYNFEKQELISLTILEVDCRFILNWFETVYGKFVFLESFTRDIKCIGAIENDGWVFWL